MKTLVSLIIFVEFLLLGIWAPKGWNYLFQALACISYVPFAVFLYQDVEKLLTKIQRMNLDCKRRCEFYLLSIFLLIFSIGIIILFTQVVSNNSTYSNSAYYGLYQLIWLFSFLGIIIAIVLFWKALNNTFNEERILIAIEIFLIWGGVMYFFIIPFLLSIPGVGAFKIYSAFNIFIIIMLLILFPP